MSKTLVWQQDAAREIIDALSEERERVAYYASGQGDGWARSYGAGNFSHPDYAAIIAKHYEADNERLRETIDKMDCIHTDIMENGPRCTCGEGDEWCKRCGKSIKLSNIAHAALKEQS